MLTVHFQNTAQPPSALLQGPIAVFSQAATDARSSPSPFNFTAEVIYTLPCLLGPPRKYKACCQHCAKTQLNDQLQQSKFTLLQGGKTLAPHSLLPHSYPLHSYITSQITKI